MGSPLLTMESLSPDLERAIQFVKFEEDFPSWLVEHGVIDVRNVGLVPFKDAIWPFQVDFAWFLQNEPRIIILKARQLGVSTLAMHYVYWKTRFSPPKSQYSLILSKSKDDASYLLEKVSTINKQQPPDIRMTAIVDRTFGFELDNENAVECVAATEAGARSRAATLVVLDEHAFHSYAEKNWASVQPTLDGGGQVIIISTGNGMGNLFHQKYQEAKERRNNFKAFFIPFHAAPHRDEEWLESQRMDFSGAEELFGQEYPKNDNEAFAKTGSSPFDMTYIAEQITRADSRRPDEVRHDGRTRVWQRPLPSLRYAAGLDCAHGVARSGKADFTSLKIIDERGTQVASWEGRIELGPAAQELFEILQEYLPYLVVERNGPGSGMTAALQALGYKRFYRFEQRHLDADAPPEKSPTIGGQMTAVVKSRLIGGLVGRINARALDSLDGAFWRECSTFVQSGPNKWGAQGSNHDDQVIAMAWALWGLAFLPIRTVRKKKRIRWR